MEIENAQSEGRTREMVDEEKEFDEVKVSTEDTLPQILPPDLHQNLYLLLLLLIQSQNLLVSDQAKEIKLLKAKINKLKKQAKPVIKNHKAYLKSVSLQQRFPRNSYSKKHRVHKESVSKQGRKKAKGESSVQRDPLFDVMPEDKIDHMETENAQSEGRSREMVDEDKDFEKVSTDKEGVSTDFEKVSTDRPIVSTDGSKVSTDDQNEGTEEQIKGTEDQTKEEIASQASQTSTQTPTSMIFGDDETIATLLLNMSQAKAASKEKEKGIDPKDKGKKKIEEEDESESEYDDIPQFKGGQREMWIEDKEFDEVNLVPADVLHFPQHSQTPKAASKEKEKGVELKDVEEIDRPRPTSQRSLLTLKPLPKIDPKDKGKKKIEEEDESESEDDDIPQAVKKIKQLESYEEMDWKIQKNGSRKRKRNKSSEEKATNEALIKKPL
ncbi:hypothetical protein Tco_0413902 [Tanacetum coccineum]